LRLNLGLSKKGPQSNYKDCCCQRNLCVLLGCLAEKLAGSVIYISPCYTHDRLTLCARSCLGDWTNESFFYKYRILHELSFNINVYKMSL